MASLAVVVGGGGGGLGGRGCYVLLKKIFFSFFDGKSVMSALCSYYYICMFVKRGPVGRLGHGLKPSSSQ